MALQKAKLALAIATVSSSLAMTGCLVDGDKSNTSSTTVQQDASRISVTDQETPRAEILGIVQDTNGNPVAGARVSIGSAATTTDANGAYSIANVAVTGFTGTGGGAAGDAIQVSVVPKTNGATRYLNATVSVTPQASTIIQTVDGAHTNTEDALLAIVTTDGLAVSAGITVVPALQSTVSGVLRDDATGEIVANTIVGLEVVEVNNVNQQQQQNNGAGTSYGVGVYQAATDAEGRFTFENLPVDTDFDISIEGWTVDSLTGGNRGDFNDGIFATTPEVAIQNIGTLYADLITSQDDIDPFVTSVTGVVVNGPTGLLNDDLDGTQGLTIHFSEPLQAEVDENSVYVYNKTTKSAIALTGTPVLSADGRSLTLTTAAAIQPDNTFEIYLSKVDFQDMAGNDLVAVLGTPNFKGEETPGYDSNAGVTSVGSVKLELKTFADPVTTAGAVVGSVQLLTDGGDSAFEVLQNLNATFADVDTGSLRAGDTFIEQLNEPEADARLTALATATYSEAGLPGAPGSFDTDVARVQFTIDNTTESDEYQLVLTNGLGVAQNVTIDVSAQVGTLTNNGTDEVTLTLEDGFQGTVDLLLESVEPGWTLTISSLTSFGSIDGVDSVVLTDQIAPTTVLQNSYGQGENTNSVVGLNYGNGGELSEVTTATMGTPLLNITPRLLTPQVGEAPALPVGETWDAIRDLMQDIDPADGDADVNTAGLLAGYTAYDATAFAAWTVGSRKIGIAVSEDVALSGTPAVTGIAQGLTGWKAQNDVVVNDQGNPVTADLINVTVPNVIDFANDDHGGVIDLTGNITDPSGNTAAAANNAKVVVNDLMPPLPVSAVYNGEQIVLTYNENVVVPENADFILDGTGGDQTITVADVADITVAGATVTIPREVFGDIDSEVVFNRGSYDHDGNVGTADAAHGVILTRDVEDQRGVSWDNWDGGAGLVAIPGMVIRDDAGAFETSNPVATGFNNAATSFTVVYRFTHRIDLQTSFGAAAANALTGAEVAGAFTLTSAATINNTGTSASLDPTGRELTVNVSVTGAPLATNDTFGLTGGSIQSEWDNNDPVITTLSDVTAL